MAAINRHFKAKVSKGAKGAKGENEKPCTVEELCVVRTFVTFALKIFELWANSNRSKRGVGKTPDLD
jgi:hypothetical protein